MTAPRQHRLITVSQFSREIPRQTPSPGSSSPRLTTRDRPQKLAQNTDHIFIETIDEYYTYVLPSNTKKSYEFFSTSFDKLFLRIIVAF